jgi:hypothetical protein
VNALRPLRLAFTFAALTAFASGAETDFAGLATAALARLAAAQTELAAATRLTPDDAPPDERLFLARLVARGVAATELAALHERRGATAVADPAHLTPPERRLVLACLRLDFDYAQRRGHLALAERELARLRPWIEAEEPAAWPALVERVAAMDYHAEPEVPEGEELLARASNDTPSAALFASVEALALAHPDLLRAHFPRLILYRRAGREADLDRAAAELLRLAPCNRSLRTLAADIRAVFAPVTPAVSRVVPPAK